MKSYESQYKSHDELFFMTSVNLSYIAASERHRWRNGRKPIAKPEGKVKRMGWMKERGGGVANCTMMGNDKALTSHCSDSCHGSE